MTSTSASTPSPSAQGAPASGAAEYLFTIDVGTSGPKVALVSTRGDVLGGEFEPVDLLLLPDGGAEQDPHAWWSAICTASRRLLAQKLVPREAIIGVCCTSQWSGTVAVDASGKPLMNAIIWMDTRGAPHVQRITGGPIRIEGYGIGKLLAWLPRTGGLPTRSGKDSIAHILYLKHERPDIYNAAYKFLEPKDYLNLKMTGLFAAGVDSIALTWVTDNRDIHNIRYDEKLLKLSTIDRAKLPDLKLAVDVLGPLTQSSASELGLPAGLPVVMGAPDTHSAAIGSGAVRDYEAHLYLGTSSWLIGHVPFKKTDILHNMASLPSSIPGRYLLLNEQECAGVCLTFLRDKLFFPDDVLNLHGKPDKVYALFDQLAETSPPGSRGVIFNPWLYGERTPVEDHTVRGGFFNLSLQTTRADMVRAVLEGVAFNARWLRLYVEKFMGRPLESIHVIGGGASSPTWCQIVADILDRPVKQMADPLWSNSRGVGLLGAVGLKRVTFDEVAAHAPVTRVFSPNQAHRALYTELFDAFIHLYERQKALYARLNRSRH